MKITIVIGMFCAWCLVLDAREEMGIIELLSTTKKICNKDSDALWEVVIKCHDNITESYLRASDEANCPRTSSDLDPKDTRTPLVRAFKVLCNVVGYNPITIAKSLACLKKGHDAEVLDVQKKFGENVPEDIVKCIRAINLDAY